LSADLPNLLKTPSVLKLKSYWLKRASNAAGAITKGLQKAATSRMNWCLRAAATVIKIR
jgi:hypothetical protein